MGQCATSLGFGKTPEKVSIKHLLDSNEAVSSALFNKGARKNSSNKDKSRNTKVATKLLLLGTGNSGKSTVFKQFQLMYANGFSDEERNFYKKLMTASTIGTIRTLLQNTQNLLFEGLISGQHKVDETGIIKRLMQDKANEFLQEGGESVDEGQERKMHFAEAFELGSEKKKLIKSVSTLSGSTITQTQDEQENMNENNGSNETSPDFTDDKFDIISEEIQYLSEVVHSLPDGTELWEKKTVMQLQENEIGEKEKFEVEMTVAEVIERIWLDPIIQKVYSIENKMPTLESPIEYYMEAIRRIGSPTFVPTDLDILHSRKQTRKVQELSFKWEGKHFNLIDVGGQRIERRKWLNYFDDVDAVIFVVGLDGYNQLCIEDGRTNRMRETLALFKDICDSPYFSTTNFLLFLNKSDLFKEKIVKEPLSICFKSYKGKEYDYDQAISYIRKRFEDTHTKHVLTRNASVKQKNIAQPKVYSHVTCATASEHMRFIIATCQTIFLRQGLAYCGIAAM